MKVNNPIISSEIKRIENLPCDSLVERSIIIQSLSKLSQISHFTYYINWTKDDDNNYSFKIKTIKH